MKNIFAEVYTGLKSLFTGMGITMGQFFKPKVTVQYPHQSLKMPARFRGHIELVRDPSTGKAICYACKLCERACPSDCITVEGVKLEGAKKKSVNSYKLDFTKCSLCGSCVEACRDSAIQFSREYNRATLSKDELVMDLFNKLQDESRAAGYTPDAPVPAAAPAPAPAAPGPAAVSAPAPEAVSALNRLQPAPAPVKLDPARAAAPESINVKTE